MPWADVELGPYGRQLEIWYLRSGTSCDRYDRIVPADEPFVDTDRIYWRVGERWRPDPSTVEAWRRTVGPDDKYCFLQDTYDQYGKTVTWQLECEDGQRSQYVLDLEWEEPGRAIDLMLGQLKKPYERNNRVFWALDWKGGEYLQRVYRLAIR